MDTVEKKPLAQFIDLKKYFKVPKKGMLHAVDGLNLEIYPGETVGLVGESGCGKSTVGNLAVRLLDPTDGQFIFEGTDLFKLNQKELLKFRQKIQMIFQDPYSSLNPKKRIRAILEEAYKIHHMGTDEEIERRILSLCEKTGISPDLLDCYPHELDGGKRQIVGIARALSMSPELIICDEPVSSLDVSIQAKIINMLMDMQKEMNLSYLFISHDLSVVRHISNRVAAMYLGQIVEIAETDELFSNTMHPYSLALLSAIPKVDVENKVNRIVLKGDVPSPINPQEGCRFAPRCWMACEECFQRKAPSLVEVSPGHKVACHFAEKSREAAKSAETTSIEE